MNVLVPTALFRSMPRKAVNTTSIIIPPPEPTKPVLQEWIGEEDRINAKQETELILKLAGAVCRWTP